MTRSGRASGGRALAELFASDAHAAVLRVLREADRPLTAIEVKRELRAGGVGRAEADRAWPGVQKRLRSDDRVVLESLRYRWGAPPRTPSPDGEAATAPSPDSGAVSAVRALELLVRGGLAAGRRAALAAVVRSALTGPGEERDPGTGAEAGARQRQAEIDAVRALAELASEVEELTANEVEPAVMIRQVRAWVKRSGLEPIDRAGEETRFDRKRHRAIGRPIADGAPVVVVRPGYVWKAPTEDVLIGKAIVEE